MRNLTVKDKDTLLDIADAARLFARPKISGFHVGAALLDSKGRIYRGCNVEFDNYTNTIHAEVGAIAAAMVAGATKILMVAVVVDGKKPMFPCGMCLQSLYEIGGPDLVVLAGCNKGFFVDQMLMKELYPQPFGHRNIGDPKCFP